MWCGFHLIWFSCRVFTVIHLHCFLFFFSPYFLVPFMFFFLFSPCWVFILHSFLFLYFILFFFLFFFSILINLFTFSCFVVIFLFFFFFWVSCFPNHSYVCVIDIHIFNSNQKGEILWQNESIVPMSFVHCPSSCQHDHYMVSMWSSYDNQNLRRVSSRP